MQKYDYAVLLIGSPNLTFQAAASTVARLLESFEIDKISAFYSGFAEQEALKVVRFAKMLFDKDVELVKLPTDLQEAITVLEQALKQGKAIAIPTSGSLLGAVSLTLAASRTGSDIGHVLFPFGPWTGLFYPYVPRYLQPMQVLGDHPAPRLHSFNKDMAVAYLDGEAGDFTQSRLLKRLARICVDFNLSLQRLWINDSEIPKLVLELSEEMIEDKWLTRLLLKTFTSTLELCRLREVKLKRGVTPSPRRVGIEADPQLKRELFAEFTGQAFAAIARAQSPCRGLEWMYKLAGFSVLDLKPGETYLIDTNLVYQGVHNTAKAGGPRVLIPYCVHAEVLNKVAESKHYCEKLTAEALLLAYEVLEAYAGKVPSMPYKCDVAIPAVEPELIKNALILTSDRRAFELWNRLILSKYARIALVEEGFFRPPNLSEAHYALLQLAAMLCELAEGVKFTV
ncbi:MAG: hypothetical protein QXY49_00630 [Thermofilaceae archaeon]